MTNIIFQNIDLKVVQQSNEIVEEGVQNLHGALSVNHDNGLATFVEAKKKPKYSENLLLWEGAKLKLRINKDGKVRGTFVVDVPADMERCDEMLASLDHDFVTAIDKLCDYSYAKRPLQKKIKKSQKVSA